ncbi:MAG: DHH family phosphoesterase [Candidatus Heimdallarchaeota archaeon]|nr:MAG: DHH family phosphoesterase [Candidatus Heimdallarchaeota archaeon]
MTNKASFFEACQMVAEDLQKTKNHYPIYIFSHFDADGLAAASILAATLSQADINYQIRILERLEYSTLNDLKDTLPHKSTVIFSDIGTGVIESFSQWKQSHEIFILDHHSPTSKIELSGNIRHLNPHYFSINGASELSGAGVAYFVSVHINPQNKYLAPLALIGALGDRQDQGEHSSVIGLNKLIVEDAKKLDMVSDDVSVWFFDRTRPIISVLRRAEFLGFENEIEIRAFLERLDIPIKKGEDERAFYDLSEEECRRLASELIVQYNVDPNEIYKKDYKLNHEDMDFLKDARVFVTKLNACGKLQRPDIGISLCLGDRQTTLRALKLIEKEYSRIISQNLKWALSEGHLQELSAIHLLDGRKSINERMIGTIISILSSRRDLNPKPFLGCALTATGKVKISMRLSRFQDQHIDLGQLLNQVIRDIEPESEVGGHAAAAGAIISETFLSDFITLVNQLILEGLQ